MLCFYRKMNNILKLLVLFFKLVTILHIVNAIKVNDEIVENLDNGCTLTRSKSGKDEHMTERLKQFIILKCYKKIFRKKKHFILF